MAARAAAEPIDTRCKDNLDPLMLGLRPGLLDLNKFLCCPEATDFWTSIPSCSTLLRTSVQLCLQLRFANVREPCIVGSFSKPKRLEHLKEELNKHR